MAKRAKTTQRGIYKYKVNITFFLMGMTFALILVFIYNVIANQKKETTETAAKNALIEGYEEKAQEQIQASHLTPTASPEASMRIPILMYHYVEDVQDRKDITRIKLSVSPADFETQLQALKQNATKTAFAREIPKILSRSIAYDPNMVVLTFDDGYEDFYTNVFPLLKKYNMKGTVYIIYDYIGRKDFLKHYQINDLLASGLIEVGSHTLDHYYLKQAPYDEVKRQIIESKQKLEDAYGSIETFAYPFGALDDTSVNLVKEAGYTAAVTVVPGINASEENLYTLPRIRPEQFIGRDIAKALENYR